MRQQGCSLMVVDGGSRDQTVALAEPLADLIIVSAKSRAAQLSRRLKRHGWPVGLRQQWQTSSRRWERDSILRTIMLDVAIAAG